MPQIFSFIFGYDKKFAVRVWEGDKQMYFS